MIIFKSDNMYHLVNFYFTFKTKSNKHTFTIYHLWEDDSKKKTYNLNTKALEKLREFGFNI